MDDREIMASLLGQLLGRYHILEQLGEGGMATVYKAYDTRLERDVAIKIIRRGACPPEQLNRILKRFEREAKALAKLSHPNIVGIIDYGEYEDSPYFVMEYLPGGTLKQKLGKPIPWQEAAQLLIPIAEALDYAHSQNMIHRDVKPSNILLTQRGQPMLTDFGIAKVLDLEETQDLTGTGSAVGTPEYMAPEQATAKFVDYRADIYALGIVFYEMVTGRKPFIADTPMAVLIKQSTEPLPRPKQYAPNLPDGVEKILLKTLAKKPDNRYQSMAEFVIALKQLVAGKVAVGKRAEVQPKVVNAPSQATRRIEIILPSISRSAAVIIGIVVLGILSAFALITLSPRINYLTVPSLTPTPTITLTPIFTWTPELTFTPTDTSTPIFTPTITPIGTPLLTEITDAKGVPMRLVSKGAFTMGDTADKAFAECRKYSAPDILCPHPTNEEPPHTVYLDAFYMDKYEVTNALYQTCVGAGVCDPPRDTKSRTRLSYYGNAEYDNYPVIYVDWNMARTYCKWRGASLPTEVQWEKAARGTDGRTFPWGEGIDCTLSNSSYLGEDGYCIGDTTKVGSYERGKSPYGLYEMAGNVWEWVADWYSETYYQISPSENPLGPSSGQYRVVRGGSWGYGNIPRSSYRLYFDPSFTNNNIGFRCARSAP